MSDILKLIYYYIPTMNSLYFLPEDIENIIVEYKEELEKEDHKILLKKVLDELNDIQIIVEQSDNISFKSAQKAYIEYEHDLVNAIMSLYITPFF